MWLKKIFTLPRPLHPLNWKKSGYFQPLPHSKGWGVCKAIFSLKGKYKVTL